MEYEGANRTQKMITISFLVTMLLGACGAKPEVRGNIRVLVDPSYTNQLLENGWNYVNTTEGGLDELSCDHCPINVLGDCNHVFEEGTLQIGRSVGNLAATQEILREMGIDSVCVRSGDTTVGSFDCNLTPQENKK